MVCLSGGAGHRLQLGLHTPHRTALVPRRDRVPLGVAWERHGYKAGPPRLPFPFSGCLQISTGKNKNHRFEVWKSTGKLVIFLDSDSPKK